MIYLSLIALTYLLKILLKLNWISTVAVLCFLLVMQRWHKKKHLAYVNSVDRFEDVSLYIDTLLYSFMKERKIIRAFEDTWSTFEDGTMKQTIQNALDHMRLTFDETEVLVDAMKIIETEYNCNRIKTAHEFMEHAEYYGGDINNSARILLKDKSSWERRIHKTIEERKRMFTEIIMSVVMSIVICGIVLHLPVLNMDISTNIFVQILAVIVVILDDFIILRGQGYLSVDYLTVDLLSDEQKYVKKLEDYKNYDYKKEFKRSILYSIIPAVIMCVCLLYGRQWWAAAAMGIMILTLNQHKIGHKLMKKNITRQIKSAFPKWLMDIALLIQSENVQVAIQKSREHVPLILRGEVEELIGRLDMEPESSGPYHRFLEKLTLPQINAAMGMLYAVSIGNSGNAEDQIDELITKNLEMLDIADSERLKDNTAGMYLLFLAPVVTASFKLIVDMAVFLLGFLSYKVI